jgi:hypothetical protein
MYKTIPPHGLIKLRKSYRKINPWPFNSTLVLSLLTVNSNKKKKENQGMTLVKTKVL